MRMPAETPRRPSLRFFLVILACAYCSMWTAAGVAVDKADAKPAAKGKPGTKSYYDASRIGTAPTSRAGSSSKTERVGEDWAEFLGPRRTGISGETGLLPVWPKDGPPIVWSKRCGTGYTAPSVRGNMLVLFHRIEDEEVVEALQADTGKLIWRSAYATAFEDPYGYNNGPRCAPLLTNDRCYTFGAEGRLTCFDLNTGAEVWVRNTAQDFHVPPAFFGVGSTPILEGDLLYVMVGGQPESGMVAFDAKTGKTVWESVGLKVWDDTKFRYQPDGRLASQWKLASYSTPITATIHGKRHLLCLMRPGLVSLDPLTGAVNFSFFFRSVLRDSVNAARPVVVGDEVFLSAAYDVGAALLKVHEDGRSFDTVWQEEPAMQNHWSTSIEHQGYVYGFSGRHEPGSTFRCIEWKTGNLKWETQDVNAGAEPDPKAGLGTVAPNYYGRGSAILADGKFIVLGERGLLALVELNPEKFVEISRVKYPKMKYPSWAAPVLSRKRLYLRCEDYLLCVDLAAAEK